MSEVLSSRDSRLGNFVPHRTLREYAPRFAQHFTLEMDSVGVLMVRMHSDDGPALWSRGLLNAWNLLLADIGVDRDVEALVITGTGDAWIAGVQRESFALAPREWHSDELDEQFADSIHLLERLVTDVQVPTVAALNGPGFRQELALMCDLTLATPDVSIGDGNFMAGSVPGDGMYLALRELIGPKRAAHMVYTGARLSAHEACEAGVVNEVVERTQIEARALELARSIVARPRTARRLTHGVVTRPWQRTVVRELLESYSLQAIASTR